MVLRDLRRQRNVCSSVRKEAVLIEHQIQVRARNACQVSDRLPTPADVTGAQTSALASAVGVSSGADWVWSFQLVKAVWNLFSLTSLAHDAHFLCGGSRAALRS